jgi:fumarate reductase subunit D
MKKLYETRMWGAITALIAVFIVDILAPLGIAVDVLYISCIVLVLQQNQRTIFLYGLAASTLIMITLIVFYSLSKVNPISLINHGISEIAIIITTYITET